MFLFFIQSELVYLHNRPGESAGINIFRSVKMPWSFQHSFLATPKLFFSFRKYWQVSYLFVSLILTTAGARSRIQPWAESLCFVPVVWHIAGAN